MSISRRDFLRISSLGFGGAFLAACGVKQISADAVNAPSTSAPLPLRTALTTAVVSDSSSSAEILGRPTDKAVTVNVIPMQNSDIYFEYGTSSGSYTAQTPAQSIPAGVPVNVTMDNLQRGVRYFYRTRHRQTSGSEFIAGNEHTFITQRNPGESFTFTIDAGPHNRDPNFNSELYAITLSNALKDQPDFHINLGDTFMTEKLQARTLQQVVNTYADIRPHLGMIGADAPLFLVNGNHEGELGWLLNGGDQNLAVWCTETRHEYYPNPAPNDFYSGSTAQEQFIGIRDGYFAWTWGDALFVALDPFWYTTPKPQPNDWNNNWNWTLGKAQYDWLKSTLENSKSKFKFVFIHNLVGGNNTDGRGGIEAAPYFEWGGKNADGSYGFDQHRAGWGVPIHQLLIANHVSTLFHGHDHVFVKQDLDGIVYQECPQPSITKYNNTQLAQQYGYVHGDVVSSSGHLRVTVTPQQVTVDYVRAYLPKDEKANQKNGQVSYSYIIK